MTILDAMAAKRTALHADRGDSSRPLSSDFDEIGMAGEIAFGTFSGLCPDFTDRPKGDHGYDFKVPLLYRVEVKATKPGGNLIHRIDKPLSADIYVLAEVDGDTTTLLGWCWKRVLAEAEIRQLKEGGFKNRFLPRENLRPMSELESRLWKVPA